MKLHLSALDSEMADAWRPLFGELPNVLIDEGDILEHTADAILSPANDVGAAEANR